MQEPGAEEKGKGQGEGLSSEEQAELADLESELHGLSATLGAQWAAQARVEGKLGYWEVKERELRNEGDVEPANWAMKTTEKESKKVDDKQSSAEQLERAVARLEDWVARLRRKGRLQPKVEMEKEEEEEKGEVEETVVEEKVEGMGMGKYGVSNWLREFLGSRGGGGHLGPALRHSVLDGPNPPVMDPPSPSPGELNLDSPLCAAPAHRVHHKVLGQGRWVWVDERGVHANKPLRVGGVQGEWQWQPDPWAGGTVVRPSDAGQKMFTMAHYIISTLGVKKAGAPHFCFLYCCW